MKRCNTEKAGVYCNNGRLLRWDFSFLSGNILPALFISMGLSAAHFYPAKTHNAAQKKTCTINRDAQLQLIMSEVYQTHQKFGYYILLAGECALQCIIHFICFQSGPELVHISGL